MLGVFLLPACTRLGHDCQDLLSPFDGMHVCTDKTSVYFLIRKSFGGMESEPMLTPRENPLYRKNSPQRRIEPTTLLQAEQLAQHTTNELFRTLENLNTNLFISKPLADHLLAFYVSVLAQSV